MKDTEIRAGLRKLEFQETPGGDSQAVVEFVRSTPLSPDESVRVLLGRRDGAIRELAGQPQLLDTKRLNQSAIQYRYRLHGPIRVRE